MRFCLNVWLKKFDKESEKDFLELSDLFDDYTLYSFSADNQYAKYIYFIKENDDTIGFVFLMPLKNSKIYNVRYGLRKDKLNKDYVYTTLTRIRDKVKGYDKSNEILGSVVITGLNKEEKKYNVVANTFGNKIYETDAENYYEINPNCEDVKNDHKVLRYYLTNKTICR